MSNLITLWFHNYHGLLHGHAWYGMLISTLGYGLLFVRMNRQNIPLLALTSSIIALALQHGFLDLRFMDDMRTSQESIWVIYVYLFAPILFIAWYAKRIHVIVYILISGASDIALGILLQPHFEEFLSIAIKATLWRSLAFLLIGVSLTLLLERLRQANIAIQNQAHAQAQLAESRERNRIARELHDTLAHSLSALAIQLEAIDATWESEPTQNKKRIQESLIATRMGLTETRRAIQNLKTHPLESLGLSAAIRQCATKVGLRNGISIHDAIENLSHDPPENVCHAFFRITQEAFENISRHSFAKDVTVELCQQKNEFILRIIDNGIGKSQNIPDRKTFGIQGMQERAEIINARLQIVAGKDTGYTIDLRWREI